MITQEELEQLANEISEQQWQEINKANGGKNGSNRFNYS